MNFTPLIGLACVAVSAIGINRLLGQRKREASRENFFSLSVRGCCVRDALCDDCNKDEHNHLPITNRLTQSPSEEFAKLMKELGIVDEDRR